jgi:hypothetical protein
VRRKTPKSRNAQTATSMNAVPAQNHHRVSSQRMRSFYCK